ncbi:hypothetical protein MPH_06681 [Macrophomina phaseolina MS6]|uniref:Uncharacterized protein n=1 Tax=Macrophomina phaseolina (strain MS6) TaxID=1126212 RepID=K2SH06_MACPH|nr:hypothetical protein MPH_06681 [Macrophomina phaseolina MS6]
MCLFLTVHMFEMANRASQDNHRAPGPPNSTIRSAACVFLFSLLRIDSITSLPRMYHVGLPTKSIRMDSGILNHVCPVARPIMTSPAPSPMAKLLTAPAEQVWESEPSTSIPGSALSLTNSVWRMVYYTPIVSRRTGHAYQVRSTLSP